MKNLVNQLFLLALVMITMSCQPKKYLNPREGFVEVTGGKVWYRIVGEGNNTPIILLHGGPGVPSYYLDPLAELGKDRPVIFYDQLGCGRSKQEMDTALMNVESYVAQLEQLRTALGIDEFYLYGSSWGTMLGMDYYLKYPKKVKALIFSSPCLSAKRWTADADTLIATLPDSIQLAIRINSKNGTYTSSDYRNAVSVYSKNFVVRKQTSAIDSSFANVNLTVYGYMWGPSEFTALGTLKDYDRTNRLSEIKIPTLFIAGEYDEARPSTVKFYQSLVSGATFELMENSGHTTMQDNPQQDIKAIRNFLKGVERN